MVLECKIRQFLGKNKICVKNPIKIHVQNNKALHPSSSATIHNPPYSPIVSTDGDIVDLSGNVFLLPVTELADGVQLIGHPNKEATCLYRCHMCQLIEVLHEGLDAKSFFVRKERPVLISSATKAGFTTISLEKCIKKYTTHLAQAYIVHTGDIKEDGDYLYIPLYMVPCL